MSEIPDTSDLAEKVRIALEHTDKLMQQLREFQDQLRKVLGKEDP